MEVSFHEGLKLVHVVAYLLSSLCLLYFFEPFMW